MAKSTPSQAPHLNKEASISLKSANWVKHDLLHLHDVRAVHNRIIKQCVHKVKSSFFD